jgi:hypothetical protein
MTTRILQTPNRNRLHGTDIFPYFAKSSDILEIMVLNQRRKIDFANVYSFYAYTPEELEKATYILSQFDLNVNEEILNTIKTFLIQIDEGFGSIINLNQARINRNTTLSTNKIKNWLDLYFSETRKKGFVIPKSNGTNIFFDILQVCFNEIIKKINKIISIRRIIPPGITLTLENRDTLLIYLGLYTSIFIYMLHLFFGNKFKTSDSNVILQKNPYYNALIGPIYNELKAINYGLPRVQGSMKKIQLKNIATLETNIISNSLPVASIRGGKKKISKKVSKKVSKKISKK